MSLVHSVAFTLQKPASNRRTEQLSRGPAPRDGLIRTICTGCTGESNIPEGLSLQKPDEVLRTKWRRVFVKSIESKPKTHLESARLANEPVRPLIINSLRVETRHLNENYGAYLNYIGFGPKQLTSSQVSRRDTVPWPTAVWAHPKKRRCKIVKVYPTMLLITIYLKASPWNIPRSL